jgi:Putative zinc-finger
MSDHVRDRLDAYLDRELSEDERAEVSRHLTGCSECRLLLEEVAAVDEAARSLPADAPEGYFDTFAPRVKARLTRERRRAFRPPVWSLAVAAALLLAVITPLTLREHEAPPPAAPPPAPAPTPASRGGAPAPAGPAVQALEERQAAPSVTRTDEAANRELKKEAETRPAKDKTSPVDLDAPAAAAKPHSQEPEGKIQWAPTPSPAAPAVVSAREAEARLEDGPAETFRRGRLKANPLAAGGAVAMSGTVAAGEAQYRSLQARTASTAEEARELRKAWRSFAASPLAGGHADDGRVAAIEAAAQAYAFSHDAADRAIVESDAKDYLGGRQAPQAQRVRAIVAGLDP